MGLLELLRKLDRRIIFLAVFLAAALPLKFPFNLPIKEGPFSRSLYDFIQKLPEGSRVLMSFEYDPSTKPECHPAARAIARHLFSRNMKIVAIALWPQGGSLADDILTPLASEYRKEYGTDYVNLGYKTGGIVIIQNLGKNFSDTFPADATGRPLSSLPLMQEVRRYRDLALIVSLSAGVPGIKEYVQFANAQFEGSLGGKIAVGGATTAVTAPELFPFVRSGQLVGLCAAMKGAAEYEKLIGVPGTASRGMDAQSVVSLTIVFFIILSNVVYLVERTLQGEGRAP